VRAVSEPAPRRKESQPSGVMSLHDYLRSRQKGGVR
jgi:hypothetical protein